MGTEFNNTNSTDFCAGCGENLQNLKKNLVTKMMDNNSIYPLMDYQFQFVSNICLLWPHPS